jgi:D-glycero-alpha-D-manno-heptose-7-phosphate kinase
MIISRTPLRISLGGGGTDLPGYYRQAGGGFLVAAAITKYVYVAVHDNFEPAILLKYSSIERVEAPHEVRHPLIREALRYVGVEGGIEITSMADIPAGTGLGSSGTFTVGLLRALFTYLRRHASREQLAEIACHLEIERLQEPVGKQDQYIAAIGGISAFEFRPDDRVHIRSVPMAADVRARLEENLLLFYTGVRRSASEELRALDQGVAVPDSGMTQNLDEVKDVGRITEAALEAGDLSAFGELLTQQWRLKLHRAPTPVHRQVDGWLRDGIEAGALGGKLVGAGGGGFLLYYAENKADLRAAMASLGLTEVSFGIDYLGSTVVVQ